MGVENYEPNYYRDGEKNFYINSHYGQTTLTIKGFDFYSEFNCDSNNDDYKTPIVFDKDTLFVKLDSSKLQLFNNNRRFNSIDMVGFVKTLKKNNVISYDSYTIPDSQLLFPVETDSLFIQFHFTAISGQVDEENNIKINNISAKVLIKRK